MVTRATQARGDSSQVPPEPRMKEEKPLKAREARAGAISGRVRNVLIGSLALSAVAFIVLYGWFALLA